MSSTKSDRPRRRGLTTAETVVAIAVLLLTIAGVGRFASSIHQGLRDRELSMRMGWELENARERIGSWDGQAITEQEIEDLPFSESLSELLEDPSWDAEVRTIAFPISARQVTLSMVCRYREQLARPQQITFWVVDALEARDSQQQEARNE